MELSLFAKQILLSSSLEDKLWTPERFTDQKPLGLAHLPKQPIRGQKWQLSTSTRRDPFPRLDDIARDPARSGEVFHFFANHELLALELMAWLVLKFPDMPTSLRLGLAKTMQDEQKHMQLYLRHMQEHGVVFGDLSMSPHFWNILSAINDPRQFLAGMSLTFEQANLDFALVWKDCFTKIGREQEAQTMHTVYVEEIAHVKHGLQWLRKLDHTMEDDWALHQHYLPHPLHMSKAKAEPMDIEGRKAAGLSQDYIDKLRIAGGSKGRSPDLYAFDLTFEVSLFGQTAESWSQLSKDCAPLAALFASSEDIVLVPQRPSLHFQQYFFHHFGKNPLWKHHEELADTKGSTTRVRNIHVWGQDPTSRVIAQYKGLSHNDTQRWAPPEKLQYWASKSSSLECLQALHGQHQAWDCQEGRSFDNADNALEYLKKVAECEPFIVKAAVSTSGQGRLFTHKDPPAHWEGTLQKLCSSGSVIIEPYRARVLDLSSLFVLDEDGVHHRGITVFDTDSRGTWRGSWCNDPLLSMDNAHKRFFMAKQADGRSLMQTWTDALQAILHNAHRDGLRGPVGIDALTWLDSKNELQLRPWVECNPRTTFGHLALRLRKHIAPKTLARLRLRRLKTLQKQGFPTFADWFQALPPATQQRDNIFDEGTLVLCDPAVCTQVLPCLEIGRISLDPSPA